MPFKTQFINFEKSYINFEGLSPLWSEDIQYTYHFDPTYNPTPDKFGQVLRKETHQSIGTAFLNSFKLYLSTKPVNELSQAYASAQALVVKYGYLGLLSEMEVMKKQAESLLQINQEESGKVAKDKLTHKQQILLLHSIGFFDSEYIKSLNETQKGVLLAHIVNRDEKNSEDNVRYVRGGARTSEETKKIYTKANIDKVNELLEQVGLKDYKVK